VTQHASNEPHAIVLKRQKASNRHKHHHPPLLPLLIRQTPLPLQSTRLLRNISLPPLPQISRTIIQTLAHLREFQPRSENHNPEEALRIPAQKVHKAFAEQEAEEDLEEPEEHDAGAAAGAEAVLGGEAAGAVTYGHGAEPAADEVHECDADADGGYGWGGDLGEEVGGDFKS